MVKLAHPRAASRVSSVSSPTWHGQAPAVAQSLTTFEKTVRASLPNSQILTRKQARLAEAEAFLRAHGQGKVLNAGQVHTEAMRIVATPLLRKLQEQGHSFYVGITGCADVRDEDLRWLTARSIIKSDGTATSQTNRPVLVWKSGAPITMKEAREKLQFKTDDLLQSTRYALRTLQFMTDELL